MSDDVYKYLKSLLDSLNQSDDEVCLLPRKETLQILELMIEHWNNYWFQISGLKRSLEIEQSKSTEIPQLSTPDYQTLLGRKILKLRSLEKYNLIRLGSLVLIFEAKVQIHIGDGVETEELQWRIASPDEQFFQNCYKYGFWKLVGVGIVFHEVDSLRCEYLVAVQDGVVEHFVDFGSSFPF